MNVSKYSTGKIYGIRCNTTNLLYVGSTIETLKSRESKHLTDLKGYMGHLKQPRNYRTSFKMVRKITLEDYDLSTLPSVPSFT